MQNVNSAVEGKYVATTEYCNEIIGIQPNGEFYISFERGYPPGLARSCEIQWGTWSIEGDTLILNTYYQNTIDDFFCPVGKRYDDSIEITMYSLSTMSISDEAICVDAFYYPDSNGTIVLSCSQKTKLATYINAFISHNNHIKPDDIECGMRYRYYVKDCQPTVYENRKFLLLDSGILDTKYSILFMRHADNNNK